MQPSCLRDVRTVHNATCLRGTSRTYVSLAVHTHTHSTVQSDEGTAFPSLLKLLIVITSHPIPSQPFICLSFLSICFTCSSFISHVWRCCLFTFRSFCPDLPTYLHSYSLACYIVQSMFIFRVQLSPTYCISFLFFFFLSFCLSYSLKTDT